MPGRPYGGGAAEDGVVVVDVRVVAATHVGHLRRRNEDHAVVAGTLLTGPSGDLDTRVDSPAVVAVLDGMGGHPAGDVASRLAAEAMVAGDVPTAEDEIAAVVDDLESTLVAHMRDHPDTTAMGTTLVAASLVDDTRAVVFGVGDSTARWWQDGASTNLLPLDRGPFGGITQVLGGSSSEESLRPHVATVEGPGRLLLCTDGLSDVVAPAMVDDLLGGDDPAAVAAALVEAALDRGGPDNVTLVLVDW